MTIGLCRLFSGLCSVGQGFAWGWVVYGKGKTNSYQGRDVHGVTLQMPVIWCCLYKLEFMERRVIHQSTIQRLIFTLILTEGKENKSYYQDQ